MEEENKNIAPPPPPPPPSQQGSIPPPPPPPSAGGASTNFTEGSSEPQEQPTTTSSQQVSSEQQERVGQTPTKPSVLTEQKLPVGVAAPNKPEFLDSKFEYVWDTGKPKATKLITEEDEQSQLEQTPNIEFTGYYEIDGKPVDGKELRSKLLNRDFVNKFQDGIVNVRIEDDEHLQSLAKKQFEAGSELGDKWEYLQSGLYRLGAGIEGLPAYIADGVEELTGIEIDQGSIAPARVNAAIMAIKSKESLEKTRQYEEGFFKSITEGNFADAFNQGNNMILNSAPVTAYMAVTGGAGLPVALASSIPVLASAEYATQEVEGLDRGDRLIRATAFGGAEGLGEAVTGGIVRSNFNLFKEGYKKLVKEAAKTGSEEAIVDVAERSSKELLKNTLKNYGIDTQKEGVSELLTGVAQDLTDDLLGVKEMTFGNYVNNALENYAGGVYMGGVMGGGRLSGTAMQVARREILDPKRRENVVENIKAKHVKGEIDAEKANQAIETIESEGKAFDAIPTELQSNNKVFELELEKQKLKQQIEGKDEALVTPQKERIQEIDEELKNIVSDDTQQKQTQESEEGTVRDRQQQPTQEEAQGSEVSEETQGEGAAEQAQLPTEDGTRGTQDLQGTEVEQQTTQKDAIQERETEEVPVGEQAQYSEEVVGEVAQKTGRIRSVRPKNIKGLLDVMGGIFGLNKPQAESAAVVGDVMVEAMAKRAGVSKDEMYQRIAFQKATTEELMKLSSKGRALFQIVGENAQLGETIKENLQVARGMETLGNDAKTIRIATGWEKGKDGKWRYEIEDVKLIQRFRDNTKVKSALRILGRGYEIKLKELNAFNELIEAYPELSNISVRLGYLSTASGSYRGNTITLSENVYRDVIKKIESTLNRSGEFGGAYVLNDNYISKKITELESTLLHEIQHAIQRIEGFAKGGSPENVLNEIQKGLNRIKGKASDAERFMELDRQLFGDDSKRTQESRAKYNKLAEQYNTLLNASTKAEEKLAFGDLTSNNLYKRLAGEVEARNVQTRMGMTSEQRMEKTLQETEDIARDEQIVLFQDAKGAMVSEDVNAIIFALTDPNVSTPLHELAHVYEHYLTDTERKAIQKWAGTDTWTTETSEKFARGFEKYLAEGKAPTPALQKYFDNFKNWLLEIYNGIVGSDIDIELNPKMRAIYDSMVETETEATQEEVEVAEETPTPEAKARATEFGFTSPVQARRAAVKHLGKPKDVKVEDLTDEELREASQRSTSSPVAIGNEVDVVVEEYNDRGKKTDKKYTAQVVSVNDDGSFDLKRGNTTFKNVVPKDIKKTPRKPKTTPLDDIKQGFEEYVQAMKEKSAKKVQDVTQRYKDKIADVKNKAKSKEQALKDQKDLLVVFAQDLVKGLRKSGVKDVKTSDVTSILNQVKKSNTQASVDKAAQKLIDVSEKIQKDFEKKEATKIRKDIKKKTAPSRLKDRRQGGTIKGKSVDYYTRKYLDAVNKALRSSGVGVSERINELQERANLTEEEQIELVGLKAAEGLFSSNLETVKESESVIKEAMSSGRTAFSEQMKARADKRNKAKEEAVDAITKGGGVKKGFAAVDLKEARKNVIRKTLDKVAGFLDMQEGLRTLLDKVDRTEKRDSSGYGGILDKLLYRPIAEGRSRKDKLDREMLGVVTDFLTELYGGKKQKNRALGDNQKRETVGTFVDANGENVEVKMSQNTAYRMYQYNKNPNNKATFDAMGWTEEMHKAVENFLTPETKKFADWQMSTFYPMYYEMVNEVYKDMNYIDLPFDSFVDESGNPVYVPIIRAKGGLDAKSTEVDENIFSSPEITYGSLKGRRQSTKAFDLEKSGTDVLLEYMATMNHYIAMAQPIKEASIILGDSEVREAIKQNNPPETYSTLQEFIEDLSNEMNLKKNRINLLDKLRGNTTIASLALAPVVFIKQLTSIPAYATDIPTKSFIEGLGLWASNPIKAVDTLMESDYMKRRYEDGFDRDMVIAMKKDWQDALKSNSLTSANIKNKLMFLTKWGDKGAILVGGYAVYNYHYKKNIASGMSPKKAKENALVEFEEATKLSQQSSNIEDLSSFQRGGSIAKLFTMYMTSPIAYFRQERKSIRDFKKGVQNKDKNLMKNAAKRFGVYHIALPVIFQYVANGLPGILTEWDEDDEDDLLMAGALGSLNGIFLFGSLIEYFGDIVTGKPWSHTGFSATPAFDAIADLIKETADIFTTWADEDKMANDILKEVIDAGFELDNMVGYPVDRVKKMYENWEIAINNEEDLDVGERAALLIGWSPHQVIPKKESTPDKNKNANRVKRSNSRPSRSNIRRLSGTSFKK